MATSRKKQDDLSWEVVKDKQNCGGTGCAESLAKDEKIDGVNV